MNYTRMWWYVLIVTRVKTTNKLAAISLATALGTFDPHLMLEFSAVQIFVIQTRMCSIKVVLLF